MHYKAIQSHGTEERNNAGHSKTFSARRVHSTDKILFILLNFVAACQRKRNELHKLIQHNAQTHAWILLLHFAEIQFSEGNKKYPSRYEQM